MKRVATVLLASAVAWTAVPAHEIHTTYTSVSADAHGYTLTVRAFADDLSASVARYHRRLPPADSSIRVPEAVAYASDRMGLASGAGAHALQSCGMTRVHDAYVLCFRIAAAPRVEPLHLGNQMLVELHADQVNIIQCQIGSSRRTSLFTRGKAPAVIAQQGVCR